MRAAEWTLLLLVPVLLGAAGVWLVPARSLDAPEEAMRIRGDTLQYEAMAEGGTAQAPFAYRPAVPFLASLLPCSRSPRSSS